MDYVLDIYRQMFASLKRGNHRGVFSNAKPIYLISLIDYLPALKENEFKWGDKAFLTTYLSNTTQLVASPPTPIIKPFFHLSSEPFYTLVWRENPPDKLLKFPSARLLKDYLDYAKLDDELWKLLQDESSRLFLRECIIKNYFD